MSLNEKQALAVKSFEAMNNTFITGPAGTGKSYLLKEIVKISKKTRRKLGLTATTGISANLIGGRTINSFMGIGLGTQPPHILAHAIKTKKKPIYKVLKGLDVLVIEEVSMLSDILMEKISDILSIIRDSSKPFGGVQIFLIGDFCQLPPVSGDFCFKSPIWKNLNLTTVVLTESIRHQNDNVLQKILDEVRWGTCSKETEKFLMDNNCVDKKESTIIPTKLFSLNVDVDAINNSAINNLIKTGVESKTFPTQYSNTNANRWATSNKIPETLLLCIGSQVVVTWNINPDAGIVNGTRGIITQLTPDIIIKTEEREFTVCPVTVTEEFDSNSQITYIPLKLAYALTIHRCQGMTLDNVEADLGSAVFENGQAYTALSRVRDISSIKFIDLSRKSFRCHLDVVNFYKNL